MNVYSRIGLVSALAFAGTITASAFADTPVSTTSLSSTITSVSTSEPYSLRNGIGRYLAVHFLPAPSSPADATANADFVKSYARAATTLAGVREVFVLESGPEQAKQWSTQLGENTPDLYIDPVGSLAAELHLVGGASLSVPTTIVFDTTGTELFRQVGTARHDHLTFATFEQKLSKATESPGIREYNLSKVPRLAVDGYDVVAYFTENKAVMGKPAFTSTYRGVKYQFSSEERRAAFAKDPEKYLPTYGGWCASAMGAKGTKVEIDPTNFKVEGGRLFLFYKDFFSDALKDWNKQEKEWEPAADVNWKKLSGEDAQKPAK
ncbi:MAG: YHS domain-containing (seleno)protein [Phycisphaerales bacterium]